MIMTIGAGVDEKDGWAGPWLLGHANYRQAGCWREKKIPRSVESIGVIMILWAFHCHHVAASFLSSGSPMAASGYGERGVVAPANHLPEWRRVSLEMRYSIAIAG